MDGILNLAKPRGLTSHDVVNRVRHIAGLRRVGHAGTLDPMATGVLVLCLGRATRVAEYLMSSPKRYRARVLLGVTTDTYDVEGRVVAEKQVQVTQQEVEEALTGLRGSILQIPPMYSAIKHRGQRLYKLARQGVEVERPPRPVEIYGLQLTAWEPPEFVLDVHCSPGTYVRSLAHDLGETLGCGACLSGLVRLSSGELTLEEAVPLDELSREMLPSLLLPLDTPLLRYPALNLTREAALAVCNGRAVDGPAPQGEVELGRAYAPDGTFLAVMRYRPQQGDWQPHKVLAVEWGRRG